MAEEQYKRGQIVWVIWKILCFVSSVPQSEPVPAFLTRVKRLYEIDRDPTKIPSEKTLAFTRHRPKGSGVDVGYTMFDAFCIAIALHLVDIGVKQVDAVKFVKMSRKGYLKAEYDRLMKDPPSLSKQLRKPPPGYKGPTYVPDEKNRLFKVIDERRFMIVPRYEIFERLRPSLQQNDHPVVLEPRFCHGVEELSETIRKEFGSMYNNVILMDIGTIAGGLAEMLPVAPDVKRGRA